ncbi:MAG: chemotaxis protein CheB [Desulfosarcinaceae bacterium]|nr:chemotaxis protein CheB [Desulfosarcinaceae bacterium]
MILFCEECGEQHQLDTLPDQSAKAFRCHKCSEILLIPSGDDKPCRCMPAHMAPSTDDGQKRPLKILIVDDSGFIRKAIRRMFEADSELQVVGEAKNGIEAIAAIPKLRPDVVTLDINMPQMDGLTTLKHIMIQCPCPVVMFSTLTKEGAKESFDALRYGAVDFLQKPSNRDPRQIETQEKSIIEKIKAAAATEMDAVRYLRRPASSAACHGHDAGHCEGVIGLGASEGGYSAFLKIIPQLQPELPVAYLGLLHAEDAHIDAFVDYLDEYCAMPILRAADGGRVMGGVFYLANGNQYVNLTAEDNGYRFEVSPAPFPERQAAIDQAFISIAERMGSQTVGVLLTGMGQDGIEGIGEIMRVGGSVIVQTPQTCLYKERSLSAIERFENIHLAPVQLLGEAINHFISPQIKQCA